MPGGFRTHSGAMSDGSWAVSACAGKCSDALRTTCRRLRSFRGQVLFSRTCVRDPGLGLGPGPGPQARPGAWAGAWGLRWGLGPGAVAGHTYTDRERGPRWHTGTRDVVRVSASECQRPCQSHGCSYMHDARLGRRNSLGFALAFRRGHHSVSRLKAMCTAAPTKSPPKLPMPPKPPCRPCSRARAPVHRRGVVIFSCFLVGNYLHVFYSFSNMTQPFSIHVLGSDLLRSLFVFSDQPSLGASLFSIRFLLVFYSFPTRFLWAYGTTTFSTHFLSTFSKCFLDLPKRFPLVSNHTTTFSMHF